MAAATTLQRPEPSIARQVLTLAWPVIVENAFQTLLGLVDMLLVAQLGTAAIAGVGAALQILWVAFSLFGALSLGTTVLVAYWTGARRPDEANRVVKQSLVMASGIALLLTVLGTLTSDLAIAALGAEPAVVAAGGTYLRITFLTIAALIGMFVLNAALRGAGDTRTPMVVTGAINLINAVAAYGLIFGALGLPALGVAGSAWAAALARIIGCAVLCALLWSGRRAVSLRGRAGWRPDRALIGRLLQIGVPSLLEQLLLSTAILVYGALALALGTAVYATQRITFTAIMIAFLPAFGFATAATALTGQSLGAGQPERAERATWFAVKAAAVWMALMGLGCALFGDRFMALFTTDPEIITLGALCLRLIAVALPLWAVILGLSGGLRGAGDTRFPMWMAAVGNWLVRLPIGYTLGVVWNLGLPGIYAAFLVDAVVQAGAMIWRYRQGRWRTLLTAPTAPPAEGIV